jgi:hypothetical protein
VGSNFAFLNNPTKKGREKGEAGGRFVVNLILNYDKDNKKGKAIIDLLCSY